MEGQPISWRDSPRGRQRGAGIGEIAVAWMLLTVQNKGMQIPIVKGASPQPHDSGLRMCIAEPRVRQAQGTTQGWNVLGWREA